MNLVRSCAIALVAIGLTAQSGVAIADLYDTPTVSLVEVSRSSVRLQVRAGATGAPGGIAVDWMYKSDFDQGGWDGGWSSGTLYWCTFTGTPVWNYLPGVETYTLSPYQAQIVELGDVFDESGMYTEYWNELQDGREIVVRAYALGDAGGDDSYYSSTIAATTLEDTDNCTYTQGYWKTHGGPPYPGLWPVTNLTLGTVNYNQVQLLSIFNTAPAGNGLLILAHQLIAAKLNIAAGADPTPVAAAIAAADAQIGALVIPPIGGGYLSPASVNATAQTLDNYNNGLTIVPHCGTTPVKAASWGAIKSLYR